MNRFYVSGVAACLAMPALADVAIYRDQELSIKEAVVISEAGTSYYADIKLTADADGWFELVHAERLDLAHVDEVEVLTLLSYPVQVSTEISGNFPTPCYELAEPVVTREDMNFNIVLAQKPLQTFAACVQKIEPFTVRVSLNVKGLSAGHYTVTVNGKHSSFDLAVGN